MNANQKAAYVMAQAAAAMIEALGMHAENQQCAARGHSMAYPELAFARLIDKYGLHANALSEL